MADKQEEIRKLLENMPDKYDILETGIDVQTQKEYLDSSHSFESDNLTKSQATYPGTILFDDRTDLEDKKKALIVLAHQGTITAFRQIEKYSRNIDKDLKQWTALALQECKMLLESSLTDQSTGFISSGLGGRRNKLRYYFLILPATDRPFSSPQKNTIKEELTLVAKDLNCVLESLDPTDKYVEIIVLMPMDVAVATLIETGIKKCNTLDDVVFKHYFATNMEIPDDKEIEKIIEKVRE